MTPRKSPGDRDLSRRERQIMQAVYRLGRATVAQVAATIPDPPTADAVRRLCHILEDKGHLKSSVEGGARIYRPTLARGPAGRRALEDVMDTFFAGSPGMLVASFLDTYRDRLSAEDIARLSRLIEDGEEGRG